MKSDKYHGGLTSLAVFTRFPARSSGYNLHIKVFSIGLFMEKVVLLSVTTPCMRCGSHFDTYGNVWSVLGERTTSFTPNVPQTASSPHIAVSINVPRDAGMQVRP